MKVLVDCRMLYHSGIGRYARGLLVHLSEQYHLEFTLAAPKDTVKRFKCENPGMAGFPEIHFRAPIYSLSEHLWWIHKRKDLHASIFFIPHYTAPVFAPRPLVITVHDLIHFLFPQFYSRIKRDLAKMILKRAITQASIILCDSQTTRRDLEDLFPAAAPKLRIAIPGVDPVFFQSRPKPAPPGDPYVLFVGGTKPTKNLIGLVRALPIVRQQVPNLRLGLVGRDFSKPLRTSRLPRELLELTGVDFHGEVDDAVLVQLYRGAAVVVVPSLYEGFGLPALEAMAAGAPVVISDAEALKEVAGNAALICGSDPQALAHGMLEVLTNSELAETLREKGKKRAKEFSWSRTAKTVYEAFIEIRERFPGSS